MKLQTVKRFERNALNQSTFAPRLKKLLPTLKKQIERGAAVSSLRVASNPSVEQVDDRKALGDTVHSRSIDAASNQNGETSSRRGLKIISALVDSRSSFGASNL